jgi:hypothetical protein
MNHRVRHCVECPECRTRYLVGFSPYRNGSYLLPVLPEISVEWILYCACAKLPVRSRWHGEELNRYAVSRQAYHRGYGSSEEVVLLMERGRRLPRAEHAPAARAFGPARNRSANTRK